MLVEEIFMRMVELGKIPEVKISIQKRFGDVNLKIVGDGEEFNPLIEVTDFDEESEDYFRTIILKANRSKMGFVRKNGQNIITVHVHDLSNKQIYFTIAGMIGGIIFGAVMKEILSPDAINFFHTTIAKNIRTIFLNALNMMIAPVIFFSVISGVTSITNAADVGRIGGKLIGIYTFTTFIASGIALAIGYFVFSGDVPQIGTISTDSGGGEVHKISLISMIVGLVPKNLINPIVNGEMLQIIFAAVVFGICINKLGDKVKILHELIEAMNAFCLRMIMMIVTFIPIIAFFAMASLMFKIGMDSVLTLGKLIFSQLGGSILMVGVYAILLMIFGKITPLPFLKKIVGFLPIPLSTSSSNATMPFSLKFCSQKMGISPKLSSFSIPIGATVNMDGGCFYLAIASVMLARMYGVELNFEILTTIFVTVVALSIGAPGVPGGAFVCLASIVVALGLPADATAVILGIDPICSMMRTALNTVGDISASTILAKQEKMFDEKIYFNP